MKQTELAYIAGTMDSDGSIGVNRYRGGYRIAVQTSMRNPKIPTWLYENIGGCLTKTSKDGRPLYKWMLGGNKAKVLCQEILPYLIEKTLQAKIIVRFPLGKRGTHCTVEENTLREVLHSILADENKCHKRLKI